MSSNSRKVAILDYELRPFKRGYFNSHPSFGGVLFGRFYCMCMLLCTYVSSPAFPPSVIIITNTM